MEDRTKLSRRDFLRLSAIGAASAMVAACGGGNTTPGGGTSNATAGATAGAGGGATEATAASTAASTATTVGAGAEGTAAGGAALGGTSEPLKVTSGKFQESPLLAEQVKAGKLPAVEQRLPKNPYVVPHGWVKPGKYGGVMQWTNSWGGEGVSTIVHESMYGHSILRYLKDALEIGPGLAETWEHNADATQWTFHFREGIKWSDGKPWTVKDIMYWWEDMVNNPEANEAVPDEGRSGKGTLAKFNMVDEYTLQITYDVSSPLTADRLATWVNAGIGPRWMAPRHYMEQFHPKYNKNVKDFTEHTKKIDFKTNPACPTMTGWKLANYKEGTTSTWDRNPYYWCVSKEGDQLPYIDGIHVTGYQDKEVEKVNWLAGKADFTHHWIVALTDVAAARAAADRMQATIRFWDSGSGSGQAVFFNYDYKDEKMRKVIREPKFRRAMSHAVNRADIQKNFYFNRGELTTGTISRKAIEYNISDEGKKIFEAWRDSAVKYDPEMAKKLLDEIGVKAGAGGMRTLPDGSPLVVTLDYSANTDRQTIATNEQIVRDWRAIGVDTKLNPVPPDGRDEKWQAGELLTNADWGIGDGPNVLVYPQWLVPIETPHWAPLEGAYFKARGTPKENTEKDVDPWKRTPPRLEPEKGGVVEQLWKFYDQARMEPDQMKRIRLVWEMNKLHIQNGPFIQGTVGNFPRPILVKNDLRNVPMAEDLGQGGFTDPWIHPTPAAYDPETWYWENPDQHS